MKLATLQVERAEIEFPAAGETVKAAYHPGKFTTSFLDRLGEMDVDQALAEVVADLGLEDAEGTSLPVTVETLKNHIPNRFKQDLWHAIQEDQRPNRKPTSSIDNG